MFFLLKLFALTTMAQATIPAELLTAPKFAAGESAPYTAQLNADLTKRFAEERQKILVALPKKLSRTERAKKLYAAFEIQNDLVRTKLSGSKITGVPPRRLLRLPTPL